MAVANTNYFEGKTYWEWRPPTLTYMVRAFVPRIWHYDVFDVRSQAYYDTLMLSSWVPTFCAIFALVFAVLLMYVERKLGLEDKTVCPCRNERLMMKMTRLAMYTINLVTLCEILLIFGIMLAVPKTAVTADMLDIFDTAVNVTVNETLLSFKYAFKSGYGTKGVDINFIQTQNHFYKLLFGRFMSEVQEVISQIQNPKKVKGRIFVTPFWRSFVRHHWARFVLFMVFWIFGNVITIWRPYLKMWIAAAGLFWCFFASALMTFNIIGVADFCWEMPSTPLSWRSNEEVVRKIMNTEMTLVCESFVSRSRSAKPQVRQVFSKWMYRFAERRDDLKKAYKNQASVEQDSRYLFMDAGARWIKKVIDEDAFKVLYDDKKMGPLNCSRQFIDDSDIPDESLVSMCLKDHVLLWLVIQYFAILLCLVAYVVIMMVYIKRIIQACVCRLGMPKRKIVKKKKKKICKVEKPKQIIVVDIDCKTKVLIPLGGIKKPVCSRDQPVYSPI